MRRAVAIVSIAWLVLMAAATFAQAHGVRLNRSPSVPVGVYLVERRPAERGDYVSACLPASLARTARHYIGRGPCPGGHGELLKVLAAVAGDHVRISRAGVFVDGVRWPASVPRVRDGSGRALPSALGLDRKLAPGEVLLLSEDCPDGFDGRYFGPIRRSDLQGRAGRTALGPPPLFGAQNPNEERQRTP